MVVLQGNGWGIYGKIGEFYSICNKLFYFAEIVSGTMEIC
jgi:hypothetical protein